MKQRKPIVSLLLAACLLLGLGVTGLAAEPGDPRPVILAVFSGTADAGGLRWDIGGAEEALARAYPGYEIRRAFTSRDVIDAARERDGLEIDDMTEAMERLIADGVRDVIVVPVCVLEDGEYELIRSTAGEYAGAFDSLRIGRGLLGGVFAGEAMAAALSSELRRWAHRDTAIVLAGRGTDHAANAAYTLLQEALTEAGYEKVFVGTMEADPDREAVLALLEQTGVKKVVVLPLLPAADEYVYDEIAGSGENSWKSVLESQGYKVTCVTKGVGGYRGVQALLVSLVEEAELIAVPAEEPEEELAEEPEEEPTEEPEEEPAEEPEEEPAEEPEEEPAEEPEEEPAEEPEEELTEEPEEEPVEEPEEEPIAAVGVMASDLVPGRYPLKVYASSSRFLVRDAVLAVTEDGMTALLTLEGRRYGELFPGTAADAERADEEEIISFRWGEDDGMVFVLPVTSLDTELTFAAWNIRRGCWQDQILILSSEMLPEEAFIC